MRFKKFNFVYYFHNLNSYLFSKLINSKFKILFIIENDLLLCVYIDYFINFITFFINFIILFVFYFNIYFSNLLYFLILYFIELYRCLFPSLFLYIFDNQTLIFYVFIFIRFIWIHINI